MKKILFNKLLLIVEILITLPFVYYAYQKIDILHKGGIIMIPLTYVLLFIIMIIIERALFLKKIIYNSYKIIQNVDSLISENKIKEIQELCEKHPSPVSSIVKIAINYRDKDETKIKEMIEELGYFEVHQLTTNLDYMSLLAKIAPLLGLLGTVTGLLQAFNDMLKLSGNISATVFAGGISQALLTTIFGLSIAIPTLVFHQYFMVRCKNIVRQMEKTASMIVLKLKY
ncbi:MotA/TolQ/ExbB proton channel family protein [Candidatus Dependentiae bacterium]|nr:MotA/TolQ/ExbB proton channel family protein [Candidatus Dependentiae bacterium]